MSMVKSTFQMSVSYFKSSPLFCACDKTLKLADAFYISDFALKIKFLIFASEILCNTPFGKANILVHLSMVISV